LANKQATGKSGEDKIVCYLSNKGYSILERNFRYKNKEVDIIANKDDTLIFVEVKRRKSDRFGFGFESVDFRKIQNIFKVARYYIEKNEMREKNVRFDVASIDRGVIRYIENAFQV
jgi:putative endonuclease